MSEENSQSIKSDRLSKSSLARMAGNIAAGMVGNPQFDDSVDLRIVAKNSVTLARLIAAELDADDSAKARP